MGNNQNVVVKTIKYISAKIHVNSSDRSERKVLWVVVGHRGRFDTEKKLPPEATHTRQQTNNSPVHSHVCKPEKHVGI